MRAERTRTQRANTRPARPTPTPPANDARACERAPLACCAAGCCAHWSAGRAHEHTARAHACAQVVLIQAGARERSSTTRMCVTVCACVQHNNTARAHRWVFFCRNCASIDCERARVACIIVRANIMNTCARTHFTRSIYAICVVNCCAGHRDDGGGAVALVLAAHTDTHVYALCIRVIRASRERQRARHVIVD